MGFMFMNLSILIAFAQSSSPQIPLMEKGTKTSVLFNKKGTKKLDVEVLDIIYTDSTYSSCKAKIKFQLTAIEGKIPLFKYVSWTENHRESRIQFSDCINRDLDIPMTLLPNQQVSITITTRLEDKDFFVEFDNLKILKLDRYTGGMIYRRRQLEIAEQNRLAQRLALQRKQQREDSLKLAKEIQIYKEIDNTLLKNPDTDQIFDCVISMSQDSVRAKLKHLKHEFYDDYDIFYVYSKSDKKKVPMGFKYSEASDKKKRVSALELLSPSSSDPYQGWGLSPSEKVWLKFWEIHIKNELEKATPK